MRNFLKNLQQWASIWVWFLLIVFLWWVAYAAWDYSTTVNTWDSLTAEKWNSVKDKVVSNDSSITSNAAAIVPSWAVMPFNLASCPTWWSEYTQAYGRVIRWVDKSGTNIDPDGQRALWNLQTDQFQGHFHENAFTQSYVAAWGIQVVSVNYAGASQVESARVGPTRTGYITDLVNGTPRVGDETITKNVALLYCVKD